MCVCVCVCVCIYVHAARVVRFVSGNMIGANGAKALAQLALQTNTSHAHHADVCGWSIFGMLELVSWPGLYYPCACVSFIYTQEAT